MKLAPSWLLDPDPVRGTRDQAEVRPLRRREQDQADQAARSAATPVSVGAVMDGWIRFATVRPNGATSSGRRRGT